MEFNAHSIAFIVGVSIHSMVIAYVFHPKWKAFSVLVPIPFTLAFLAQGIEIDGTHVGGIALLFFFYQLNRVLYERLKCPIILAIVISTSAFCGVSMLLAPLIPKTDLAFYSIAAIGFISAIAILKWVKIPDTEKGHRTDLPLYYKVPCIVAFVVCLLIMQEKMQGFMATSPMVGIVSVYEGRHCLSRMTKNAALIILSLNPFLITMYIFQNALKGHMPLIAAWLVYLSFIIPYFFYVRRQVKQES